ncbi:helix-turn-helix transcriptional regulator [soil metagenome]
MTHAELKRAALRDEDVKSEYERLEPEFSLYREMLSARKGAGLSQAEVAARMGTKAPAVTRLESSLTTGRHSPSVETLRKYAEAVGCRLEIHLVQEGS